jgi:hypothetical protein
MPHNIKHPKRYIMHIYTILLCSIAILTMKLSRERERRREQYHLDAGVA